jgi:hypothetical protein
MDDREVIGRLEEDAGMSEVAKVTTFKGYRKNGAGVLVEVTVDVLDAGQEAGEGRYAVYARSKEEGGRAKVATGNEAGTLEEAIAIAHWHELD